MYVAIVQRQGKCWSIQRMFVPAMACVALSIKRWVCACQAAHGLFSIYTAWGDTLAPIANMAQPIRPNQVSRLRPGRRVVYYFLHCRATFRRVGVHAFQQHD